jgi:acetolactate synthase I/III small subunit
MTPEQLDVGVRGDTRHHVLSVLVENKAGVLSRIAGLFARRGFNIYSLAVAPADAHHTSSRLTIVVDAASAPIEQVVGQLNKLINVLDVTHVNERSVIERELLLATIGLGEDARQEAVRICGVFGAEVVDVGTGTITVMLAGHPDKVDGFESMLDQFEVRELHRTGLVALPKLRGALHVLPTAVAS